MASGPAADRTQPDDCCAVDPGRTSDLGSGFYVRSIAAAVVSSACCTVPLLLVALGAGIASAATFLQLAPFVGAAAMAAMLYRDVRRRNGGVFTLDALSRARRRVVLSLAAFGGAWLVMTAIVTPLAGAAIAAAPDEPRSAVAAVAPAGSVPLRLQIEGMHCPACVYTVRAALERLAGVYDVQVSFGAATLTYDPDVIGTEEIRTAATFYVFEATIE